MKFLLISNANLTILRIFLGLIMYVYLYMVYCMDTSKKNFSKKDSIENFIYSVESLMDNFKNFENYLNFEGEDGVVFFIHDRLEE